MSVALLFLVFVTLSFSSFGLFFSLPQFPSFSLLLLPSLLPNVADALAVAPALCAPARVAPARVARAMASDFHANVNVAGGVVSGTLTACGSTPLAVWGALPKRRGNAGSDSELPYHMNTFLEVRWVCISRSRYSHPHSLSLCNLSDSPSTQPDARFLPSLLSHALPFFSLLLFFVFVFALSSSLSYLLPLCTSSSSSSPPLLLLLLGVFLLGCRLLLICFRLS